MRRMLLLSKKGLRLRSGLRLLTVDFFLRWSENWELWTLGIETVRIVSHALCSAFGCLLLANFSQPNKLIYYTPYEKGVQNAPLEIGPVYLKLVGQTFFGPHATFH